MNTSYPKADTVWVYRLQVENIPLLKKGVIHPRGYEKTIFTEDFPLIHIKCLDEMGMVSDIIISDRPIEYIRTHDYKPISLKNALVWVFSMNPKFELTIRTELFNNSAEKYFGFSMFQNINYNRNFVKTFVGDHPEVFNVFLNTCLIKKKFKLITSALRYDYYCASYIQREIEKRL